MSRTGGALHRWKRTLIMAGCVRTSTTGSASGPISWPITACSALACPWNGLLNSLGGRLGLAIRIKIGVVTWCTAVVSNRKTRGGGQSPHPATHRGSVSEQPMLARNSDALTVCGWSVPWKRCWPWCQTSLSASRAYTVRKSIRCKNEERRRVDPMLDRTSTPVGLAMRSR
jgi:hypothetical protein